jgi:hypothetical protein
MQPHHNYIPSISSKSGGKHGWVPSDFEEIEGM